VSEATSAPGAEAAEPANAAGEHGPSRAHPLRVRGEHLVVAYFVAAVAGLLVLRALIDAVDFLSVGWIIVLALVPVVPWLLPRLGAFLKAISPYVQSVKLGGVQFDLRAVTREAITVPTSGALALVPNDVGALSSGTSIKELMDALREFRRKGSGPVVVIDLQAGAKWRLPNLYFLAHLLEIEPVILQLVFTEMRGGVDGYVVGTCTPGDFRAQVERAVPSYAVAVAANPIPQAQNLDDPAQAQALGTSYMQLHQLLASPAVAGDPAGGWVTTQRVREIVGSVLGKTAIEARGGTLGEADVRAVIESPYRYVPATTEGRLSGLVDREAVALTVARAAVAAA
jgi:hypothetical protein